MNVEIGLRSRNSFSGNICFEFSVLSLCGVVGLPLKIGSRETSTDREGRMGGGNRFCTLFATFCHSEERKNYMYDTLFLFLCIDATKSASCVRFDLCKERHIDSLFMHTDIDFSPNSPDKLVNCNGL
jgi:hypothetical protein